MASADTTLAKSFAGFIGVPRGLQWVSFTHVGCTGKSSTDGSDFHRCFSGFYSAARAEKSAACNPKPPKLPNLQKFHIGRGALSLPEGAEIVSRAAARLCERPRSLPTRAPAPAGPENPGEPRAERSCAPPGAGRCFWRERWRRSRGSLADRLAIGGPAGPGRQAQFFSEREANIGLLWGASCLNRKPDGVGHRVLQSDSHSRRMPVPEVSNLASRKRSPTKRSEDPVNATLRFASVSFNRHAASLPQTCAKRDFSSNRTFPSLLAHLPALPKCPRQRIFWWDKAKPDPLPRRVSRWPFPVHWTKT